MDQAFLVTCDRKNMLIFFFPCAYLHIQGKVCKCNIIQYKYHQINIGCDRSYIYTNTHIFLLLTIYFSSVTVAYVIATILSEQTELSDSGHKKYCKLMSKPHVREVSISVGRTKKWHTQKLYEPNINNKEGNTTFIITVNLKKNSKQA